MNTVHLPQLAVTALAGTRTLPPTRHLVVLGQGRGQGNTVLDMLPCERPSVTLFVYRSRASRLPFDAARYHPRRYSTLHRPRQLRNHQHHVLWKRPARLMSLTTTRPLRPSRAINLAPPTPTSRRPSSLPTTLHLSRPVDYLDHPISHREQDLTRLAQRPTRPTAPLTRRRKQQRAVNAATRATVAQQGPSAGNLLRRPSISNRLLGAKGKHEGTLPKVPTLRRMVRAGTTARRATRNWHQQRRRRGSVHDIATRITRWRLCRH